MEESPLGGHWNIIALRCQCVCTAPVSADLPKTIVICAFICPPTGMEVMEIWNLSVEPSCIWRGGVETWVLWFLLSGMEEAALGSVVGLLMTDLVMFHKVRLVSHRSNNPIHTAIFSMTYVAKECPAPASSQTSFPWKWRADWSGAEVCELLQRSWEGGLGDFLLKLVNQMRCVCEGAIKTNACRI